MPNKAAAIKYLRASQRRRMRNKPVRTFARTTVRAALEAIDDASDAPESADWGDAEARIRDAVSALDRAAQQGVIHANTAARRKSRLLRQFHHARNPDATNQAPRPQPRYPRRLLSRRLFQPPLRPSLTRCSLV